jgi:hypothetical protein
MWYTVHSLLLEAYAALENGMKTISVVYIQFVEM